LDPLIKSEDPERCKNSDEHESTATYDGADDREHRLNAGERLKLEPIWNQIHRASFVSRHDTAHVETWSDALARVPSPTATFAHGFIPATASVPELVG